MGLSETAAARSWQWGHRQGPIKSLTFTQSVALLAIICYLHLTEWMGRTWRWKFHYSWFKFHHKLWTHCCLIKWFFGLFLDDSWVRRSFNETAGYADRYCATAERDVNVAVHFSIRIPNDKLYLSDPRYWSLMMYLGFIIICLSWSTWGRNMSNIVERWYLLCVSFHQCALCDRSF